MAGLLDMLSQASNDPAQAQGILRFGLSLLQSKGNFGNAVGAAGVQGLQGANDYRNQQFQRQIQQSQLDQMKRQKQMQELPQQFLKPPSSPGVDATGGPETAMENPNNAAGPGGFDFTGYTNALMGLDPMQGLQMQALTKKQEPTLHTAKPGEVGGTFTNGKWNQLFAIPDKADKPPSAIQEYEYAKQQGYGGTFDQWDRERKKAGASNTSIKIDNKLGEGLAKEVGPMVKESYDAARGAQQAISTADSVIKAVDSNKVWAGPGATIRLRGAQIATALGVQGKDDAEKIANTRAAIQGLAQSTLAARASLKGQGSVSDFEGKLIERAAAGDINDMTAAEIKQLAQTNKRLSQQSLSNHSQFIKKLGGNQATSGIASMFDLPTQDVVSPTPPASAASSPGVIRYDANGNRI